MAAGENEDFFPKGFKLNNVKGEFKYLGYSVSPLGDILDDILYTLNASYYNEAIDCQIVLTERCLSTKDFDVIVSVIDSLEDSMYYYLSDELQHHMGLRVWVTCVDENSSDLVICYDYFGDATAISIDLMDSLIHKARCSEYKYMQIRYGSIEPIKEIKKCYIA